MSMYVYMYVYMYVVRGPRIVVPRMLRDKVVKLAHEGHQSVVSKARQNAGGAHPVLPPVSSGEHVTGERAIAHNTHAQ